MKFESFQGSERQKVDVERLEIELSQAGNPVPHEIVVLEAADEETLRRTHSRYFKESSEFSVSATTAIENLGQSDFPPAK